MTPKFGPRRFRYGQIACYLALAITLLLVGFVAYAWTLDP